MLWVLKEQSLWGGSVILGQLFAADDFSRRHFQMHFFLDYITGSRINHKHDAQVVFTLRTDRHCNSDILSNKSLPVCQGEFTSQTD